MQDVERVVDRLQPRRASSLIEIALTESRAVLIEGARQAGKSTLARLAASQRAEATVRTLDDPDLLAAATADPNAFVDAAGMVVIDEVQRVPDLLLPIKLRVDRDPTPGQFLLTGSARILALSSAPDALPGRMQTIELWPFSQGEIEGAPDGFIDAAFDHGAAIRHSSELGRADYAERVARGGFPEAIARMSTASRRRFLNAYLNDLTQREITELGEIEHLRALRTLLAVVAARSSNLLVIDPIANDVGLASGTVRRYLTLLEEIFLIKRLPAWSRNLNTRLVGTPKVFMVDSGVASVLTHSDPDSLIQPTNTTFGPLLEGFVASEIMRQAQWCEDPPEVFHYRSRDKVEVDLVIEDPRRGVIALEVKAAASVRNEDFKGLRHLATRLGDELVVGIVLYAGKQTLSFGDRMLAMPLSALWRLEP